MKKKVILAIIISFFISIFNMVYAATGSINVSASSNQVIKGKTFTVTISGTADENITALQAGITFDSSKLSLESKSAGTGFTDASGGNNEIAILSTDNNSLSKTSTLYTLTFKVLETAEDGKTTISITNATLALVNENQEQTNVNAVDQTTTVEIKEDETTIDKGDEEEEKKDINDDKKDTNDEKKDTETGKKENKENKKVKLPQTGIKTIGFITIIALICIAIMFYKKYNEIQNK